MRNEHTILANHIALCGGGVRETREKGRAKIFGRYYDVLVA